MEIYHLPTDQNRIPNRPRSVALGIFDGVHIGHRAVIAQAALADEPCAVYTFEADTLTTKPGQELLCPDELEYQLNTLGVQELFQTDFATVKDLSPAAFVEHILHGQLHATRVTCGFNYRFGKDGVGDASLLTRLCAEMGISVTVIPPVTVDRMPVSSTAIRTAIANGDMATAQRLLGRNYSLHLPVESGQHLGRRLGMPTINQILPTGWVNPRFGVYASCAIAKGQLYPAVTNIGLRPTVGTDTPLAETWIDGFSGDLYGETVTVYPLKYLRPEQRFHSLDDLRTQVRTDAAAARALLTTWNKTTVSAIIFDFDDTLGPRDPAFAAAVDKFISRHYPLITAEEHDQRCRDMINFNNYGYGMPIPYPKYIQKFLNTWEPVKADVDNALRLFFRDFSAAYKLYEDTMDTLIALRQRGYRLSILTNGSDRLQNQKLDHCGVRPLVDSITVSGADGIHKPDPDIFRRAAARLGVPCEACLFVGDHPKNDVAGALGAGMHAVWMDPGFPPEHPCLQHPLPKNIPTITALSNLLGILPTLPGISVDGNEEIR